MCVMFLPCLIVNCSSFCVFISKIFYFLKALIGALLPLSRMGYCILIPSIICLEGTRMYFLVNTSHLWVVARISPDWLGSDINHQGLVGTN